MPRNPYYYITNFCLRIGARNPHFFSSWFQCQEQEVPNLPMEPRPAQRKTLYAGVLCWSDQVCWSIILCFYKIIKSKFIIGAAQWSSTLWSRSKMRSIPRLHSGGHAGRAFAAPVLWTLVVSTLWRALRNLNSNLVGSKENNYFWISAKLTTICQSLSRCTLCPTCTWSKIWYQTWITSTVSTSRSSLGCSVKTNLERVVSSICRVSRTDKNL